jgi:hypothetical protein
MCGKMNDSNASSASLLSPNFSSLRDRLGAVAVSKF